MLFPLEYYDIVEENAKKCGVSPLLIEAIIKAESGFNKEATSAKNARGLMQILDGTAEWAAGEMGIENFDIERIYEPELNIKIGTWYFAGFLLPKYKNDVEPALAAYNAGQNNVDKWEKGEIRFPETKMYVEKVQLYYKIYKALYKE
ncbi:MAG: lytic transglycosylase domain-containing protein [Clostridiales bacterium]|jgi:soluble lytic murein transglycosylase|nr:lytic transglycosylase domain-containing protein [Clostridiales bacterium]